MTVEECLRHWRQNLCFFCHKPGHIARVRLNRQRKPRPKQRGQWKIRQVVEESTVDKSSAKGNQADEDDSDDEFQVDAAQVDIDTYDMGFQKGKTAPTPGLPNSDLYVSLVTNMEWHRHALLIPGYIEVRDKAVEVKSLINTGADVAIINA